MDGAHSQQSSRHDVAMAIRSCASRDEDRHLFEEICGPCMRGLKKYVALKKRGNWLWMERMASLSLHPSADALETQVPRDVVARRLSPHPVDVPPQPSAGSL
jgi:hypothetical protein